MHFKFLAVAALSLVGTAAAQGRIGGSICDYYTTTLFKDNTASNQQKLLIHVVNRALIGNMGDQPAPSVNVPGILTNGTYNGIKVSLLPYFNGALVSTNGGNKPFSVNFLDGGGADSLRNYQPANSDTTNQYFLLTHLYQYFGVLLSCSKQGGTDFPAYSGSASQYNLHKFMYLSDAEVNYFIKQVALSAASFGVSESDLMTIGLSLQESFGYRCLPPTTVIPKQGRQLQSICTDNTCPLAPNNTCDFYDQTVSKPKSSNISPSTGSSTGTGIGTSTGNATMASGTYSPLGSASATANATNPPSGLGSATVANGVGSPSSPGSANHINSTVTAPKPTQVTAGAATLGLSFAVIAGGLAACFL
ncbi:uncharacterized protein EAF01_008930 [Botrytis porri]|uniref:Heme haloperoxidase family profile domain-containing protein n=1 Tax=Botrytis porri TaxID=87229 RepID=A0A4Z1K434_9HELO|nr:uncharacterized protein EAF01_008930 [Botrytis porri]KAF7897964.1 hypothetical protein EAF01_008930 [Botrytis porri]TGO80871.1 hypothetical protein BPOR_1596g00020 [Botrytis porri]